MVPSGRQDTSAVHFWDAQNTHIFLTQIRRIEEKKRKVGDDEEVDDDEMRA